MKASGPRHPFRKPRVTLIACICAVLLLTALIDPRYAVGQVVLLASLFVVTGLFGMQRGNRKLDSAAHTLDGSSLSFLTSPLPVAAVRRDGELVWYNEAFRRLQDAGLEPGQNIAERIPQITLPQASDELLTGINIELSGRSLWVTASVLRELGQKSGLFLLLFFDNTNLRALEAEYQSSRPVVAQIVVDNLDDLAQNAKESDKAILLARVDGILAEWAAPTGGILQMQERGRYLFVFEERFLPALMADKFSVLDEVRASDESGPTISIGVGRGGETLTEGLELSRQALDMALGRGGDQATVKQGTNLEFFGGKSKTVERRTKVKARVMAKSLTELMEQCNNVLVMGHRFADFDSVGSCVGIARLAMALGKQANIVINRAQAPGAVLIDHMEALPDYRGVFVTPLEGLDLISSDTLLVICDTHNPAILESREIYANAASVVVIDHHRRMTNSIDNAALSYHEPYASSASELVCELAQHIAGGSAIRKREAEAMLAGIVLDTNNYAFKTSFRTFEAAAYLKKMGGDTIEVKKLFQVDLASYIARSQLIVDAELYRGATAISVWRNEVDSTGFQIVAAQAADELLDVTGVEASFVLYTEHGRVHISARSLGGINVQLIMEALGGGGHITNAGVQMATSLTEAAAALREAIDHQLINSAPVTPAQQ